MLNDETSVVKKLIHIFMDNCANLNVANEPVYQLPKNS